MKIFKAKKNCLFIMDENENEKKIVDDEDDVKSCCCCGILSIFLSVILNHHFCIDQKKRYIE